MSDDQYFGASGKPENKTVTAMRELVAAVKDPATLHHHHYPTIGHTWTDPATGQEVMVVRREIEQIAFLMGCYDFENPTEHDDTIILHVQELLASLRAKEGK